MKVITPFFSIEFHPNPSFDTKIKSMIVTAAQINAHQQTQ